MSTHTDHAPSVVHPDTGEILDRHTDTDTLVGLYQRASDAASKAAQYRRIVGEVLTAHMDLHAKWTLEAADGTRVTGASQALRYTPEAVRGILDLAVADGRLSEEAAAAVIRVKTVEEVSRRGLTAALKAVPELAAEVEATAEAAPRSAPRVQQVTR